MIDLLKIGLYPNGVHKTILVRSFQVDHFFERVGLFFMDNRLYFAGHMALLGWNIQRGIEDFTLKDLRMRGNKSPAPPGFNRPRGGELHPRD
jgi:hypothetical protein